VNKAPDAFRTISEVAEELELPQHVLRFWETRFAQIRPMKRGGGRRYYRPDDVDLLRGIRHLLYGEGYTIRGVQRILKDHGPKFVQTVWQAGAPQPQQSPGDHEGEGAAETAEGRERSRGLLGLLPSLLAREKGEGDAPSRREPEIDHGADESEARPAMRTRADVAEGAARVLSVEGEEARAAAVRARLAHEEIAKLQATLAQLTECRRLIDVALDDNR
jgi:DNA-binding transcriptional MerR regulator